ncbi:hypothetical protein HKBW3S44_01218, partial [Candidatus Hakubella thermalkaliphila]
MRSNVRVREYHLTVPDTISVI